MLSRDNFLVGKRIHGDCIDASTPAEAFVDRSTYVVYLKYELPGLAILLHDDRDRDGSGSLLIIICCLLFVLTSSAVSSVILAAFDLGSSWNSGTCGSEDERFLRFQCFAAADWLCVLNITVGLLVYGARSSGKFPRVCCIDCNS